VVHRYNDNKTKEFSNNINQRANETENLQAFIISADDMHVDAGFDKEIQKDNYCYVSRVDPLYGEMLISLIDTQ
jgi:aromatic ring-opening dioxygenase LigB subunit